MNHQSIFELCQQVAKDIKGDFGGGSPVPKTFLMSYLVQEQNLKHFVEIGVYRGRSLFPVAYSIFLNGGRSVGIDPYTLEDAREENVDDKLRRSIDSFLEKQDFNSIYHGVLEYREKCGYGESIRIVRSTAGSFFTKAQKKDEQKFDIAHIDGNHDTAFVRQDYVNCYKSLSDGGYIVFDDIDWESVRVVYDEAKKQCPEVFENGQFGVLLKEPASVRRSLKIEKLSRKLKEVHRNVERQLALPESYTPTVAVGVLTYNQVDYIRECLDSVFTQTGNFTMKVIICDDCSTDGTSEAISSYIASMPANDRYIVTYTRNKTNLGMVKNFKKLVLSLKDSDYFTFCEGDDYYISSTRVAQHIAFQQNNPQFLVSFNRLVVYNQKISNYEIFTPDNSRDSYGTEDLVSENVIGNLGCVFYDTSLLTHLKPDIFEMYTGDWMLSIYLSQFGSVGRLNKPLNVYRRHENGVWSGVDEVSRVKTMIDLVDGYNHYTNFTYDEYFSRTKRRFESVARDSTKSKHHTLAIIDDISPHPISGFRYEEFTTLLKEVPGSKLYTTGESVHILGSDDIESLIIDYKRKHPELAPSVELLDSAAPLNADLLYCVFLGNAYANVVDRAEREKIPFIFTLYPGGAFSPGDEKSNLMLKRVMSSPYFMKVIVTQQLTYDYLVNKKFCTPDKIEYIWGVVTPCHKLNLSISKKHYGVHKKTLDICFVAHRYTTHGEDKGYDVFLDVARRLSKEYSNVRFHVVGPWSPETLSTNGIKNIRFYGVQNQDWFDEFYKTVDIMLSPNINGRITQGSFDGFPTGAATDAALRKVALFITDPLSLNAGRFVDGKEIAIIEHNVEDIVKKLRPYIDTPQKLQTLCENGYKKTNILYSKERQVLTRIKIIKKALHENFQPTEINNQPIYNKRLRKANKIVRQITPVAIKKARRKALRLWSKIKEV